MINLISETIAQVSSLLNKLQVKQLLSIFMIGFVLLTTNVEPGLNNQKLNPELNKIIHQDDSTRPKTTGEWNQQARETKGDPNERFKRIGEQSAEAIKEFGSMYTDVAKDFTEAAKK